MNTDPTSPARTGEIDNAWSALDALLKRPEILLDRLRHDRGGWIVATLGLFALGALALYGVVVGSLTGGMQLWAAPLKIAVGTLLSVLICLPSLYIFTCLSGIDIRLRQLVGAMTAATCLSALLLIGFAPVAWVFSQSTDSIALMGTLHLLFWIIGIFFGLRLLHRMAGENGGLGHLRIWSLIFIVVSLQMTTALRPIIGTAPTLLPTEKRFFIVHWLTSLGS